MTRTQRLLHEAFGTVGGRLRPPGTTMQYQSMADSTLHAWLREGLIARRGEGLVLTQRGYDVGKEDMHNR